MTVSHPVLSRRAFVVLALCGAVAAGCAQPGQLGSPAPAQAPPTVAEPVPSTAGAGAVPSLDSTPEATPGPSVLAGGRVDSQVTISTLGPARFIVLRQVIAPGTSTEWLRNPGTEVSSVQEGGVVLQLAGAAGACIEAPFGTGQAFFIADAVPYRVRNDGDDPAELVVSRLFAPDFPDPQPVPAPC